MFKKRTKALMRFTGSSLSKSEYTVINLASDGPPRLACYSRSNPQLH